MATMEMLLAKIFMARSMSSINVALNVFIIDYIRFYITDSNFGRIFVIEMTSCYRFFLISIRLLLYNNGAVW